MYTNGITQITGREKNIGRTEGNFLIFTGEHKHKTLTSKKERKLHMI